MTPEGNTRRGRPRVEGLVERRREEILAVATKVFAQRGLPGTDVQEIADLCDVGKGTVYRYFPSKDELFLATVRRVMDQMADSLRLLFHEDHDPIERLRLLIDRFLTFFDDNPDYVEVLALERAEFRDRGRLTFFEYRDALHAEWKSFHDDLEATGLLRHPEMKPEDNVVSELMYGTILLSQFSGRLAPAEQRRELLIDTLMHGMLK